MVLVVVGCQHSYRMLRTAPCHEALLRLSNCHRNTLRRTRSADNITVRKYSSHVWSVSNMLSNQRTDCMGKLQHCKKTSDLPHNSASVDRICMTRSGKVFKMALNVLGMIFDKIYIHQTVCHTNNQMPRTSK